jgi:drug/metabolite transporter (DMT)-like permease
MNLWVLASIFTTICFSLSVVLKKYLYNDNCKLNDILFVHFCVYGILCLLLAAYIYKKTKGDLFKCQNKNTKIIIITSVSSFLILIGVLLKETAYAKVSNPAYVSTILGVGGALLVYLSSIFVLKNTFEIKGFIGILLSLLGLYLITN